MGMFDWYKPEPLLSCPTCNATLREWQGKDGPCGLFVWQQGRLSPIDQEASDDVKLDRESIGRKRLPKQFQIYSYDCPNHAPIRANCETKDGVWTETEIEAVGTEARHKNEPRGGV